MCVGFYHDSVSLPVTAFYYFNVRSLESALAASSYAVVSGKNLILAVFQLSYYNRFKLSVFFHACGECFNLFFVNVIRLCITVFVRVVQKTVYRHTHALFENGRLADDYISCVLVFFTSCGICVNCIKFHLNHAPLSVPFCQAVRRQAVCIRQPFCSTLRCSELLLFP